ncbi:hypothetical protein HDU98_004406, partial [Podochytrium sp. JEL0797]
GVVWTLRERVEPGGVGRAVRAPVGGVAPFGAVKKTGFSFGGGGVGVAAAGGVKKPSWMSAGKGDKSDKVAVAPVKKLSAMQQIMEDEKRKRE